jgi:ABC-type glycerol-3-phosphate transport system substrate-binding protein
MKIRAALLVVLMVSLLAGCGGPKADVPIFMMASQGIPSDIADKLQSSLEAKVGPTPTLVLNSSPIFSLEKMIVEIAAGDNGIIILPNEQFQSIGKQGGYVPLDDLVKAEDYPAGVLEVTNEGKTEKHLYGIPLEDTKWMKDLGLNGKDLVAFIPQNAKKKEEAKQVLKRIAEK